MQYASTAAEEASALNAESPNSTTSLVTDQAFWEERGVITGYDLQLFLARATYSDVYKEMNGFRPTIPDFKGPEAAWDAVDNLYKHTDNDYWDGDHWEDEPLDDDDPYHQEEYPPEEPAELSPEYFGMEPMPRKAGMHGKFAESAIVVKVSDVRRIVREVLTND